MTQQTAPKAVDRPSKLYSYRVRFKSGTRNAFGYEPPQESGVRAASAADAPAILRLILDDDRIEILSVEFDAHWTAYYDKVDAKHAAAQPFPTVTANVEPTLDDAGDALKFGERPSPYEPT